MALLDLSDSPHGGRLRLLPENATQLRIAPRVLIFHSIVGSAEGAYRYFRDQSNLESTFIVTGGGEIWQLLDTEVRADANYQANQYAISVETEDGGDPDNQPWTPAQLDTLAWIAWEVHRLHRIPLVKATRWDGSGIGYHSQYPQWSPVAKTCPGTVRIRQFNDVLLPRIINQEEDGMASAEYEALRQQIGNGLARLEKVVKDQTGAIYNTAGKAHGDAMELAWRTHNLAGADAQLLVRIQEALEESNRLLAQHGGVLDQLLAAVAAHDDSGETLVLPPRREEHEEP